MFHRYRPSSHHKVTVRTRARRRRELAFLRKRYRTKMDAETALNQSKSNMIVADSTRGLVTILLAVLGDTSEIFHLGFVPRNSEGLIKTAEMIMIGSYEDLDTALTIAAVSYGTGETGWVPADECSFT